MEQEINDTNINNFNIATMQKRILAFLIDDIILATLITFILWDSLSGNLHDINYLLLLLNESVAKILIIKAIYQTFFVWYYGATVGKLIVKIRVIDLNLRRVSFASALIRSIFRLGSEYILYIGFLFAYFNNSKQTLHDKISKTIVVDV